MKRRITIWITLLMAAVLLLSACSGKKDEEFSSIARDCVFQTSSGQSAAAVLVDEEEGLLAVPSDAVDDGAEVTMTLPDGTTAKGKVTSNNPDTGVALVKVDPTQVKNSGMKPVNLNPTTPVQVENGDYLYIVHNVGGEQRKSQVKVLERGQKNGTDYILGEYSGSKDGLKGCSVYTASGEFAGTVAAVSANSDRIIIMPASALKQEVDNQKINPQVVLRTPEEPTRSNNYSRLIVDEPATATKAVEKPSAEDSSTTKQTEQPTTKQSEQSTAKETEQSTPKTPETTTPQSSAEPVSQEEITPGPEPETITEEEASPQEPESEEEHEMGETAEVETVELVNNSAFVPEAMELMVRTLSENKLSCKSLDENEQAPYSVALMDINGDQLPELLYHEAVEPEAEASEAFAAEELVQEPVVTRRVVEYSPMERRLVTLSVPEISFRASDPRPQDNSAIVSVPQDPGILYEVTEKEDGTEYEVMKSDSAEPVATVSVEEDGTLNTTILSEEQAVQSEQPAEEDPVQPAEEAVSAEEQELVRNVEDAVKAALPQESPDTEGEAIVYYTNRKDVPMQSPGVKNAGMTYDDAMEYFAAELKRPIEEILTDDVTQEVLSDPLFGDFFLALGQDQGLDLLSSGYDPQDLAMQKKLLSSLVSQRGASASANLLPDSRQLSYISLTPVVVMNSEDNASWAAQKVFQIDEAGYEQFRSEASAYGRKISPVFYQGVNGYADGAYYTGSYADEITGEQISIREASCMEGQYTIRLDYSGRKYTGPLTAVIEVREENGERYCSLIQLTKE